MTGPERLVPRHVDGVDGVIWRPLDDSAAEVTADRPDRAEEIEFPIVLRLGRDPSRAFLLTREEARHLADALVQADEVAGGAE